MLAVLRTLALLWLLRQAFRLLRVLAVAAVLAAAWPVTATAVTAFCAAWLLGWPPARLYRAAVRAAPVTAIWAVAAAVRAGTWHAVAFAPAAMWEQSSGLLVHGRVLPAVLIAAPPCVPAGIAAGAVAWAWRTAAMEAGTAGRHAFAPAAFDARQWRRQARAARGLLAAPGKLPLVTSRGTVPAGAVIRAIGRRWRPVLEIEAAAFTRHMVIVGASGSGKTNLMIRCGSAGTPPRSPPPRAAGPARCWPPLTARADPTPGPRPTGHAACCAAPEPAASPSGPMKQPCRCGRCRRVSWPCCCTR